MEYKVINFMKNKINIQLQLYSILREKLPPESKGRAEFQFDPGATVKDILNKLEIQGKVVVSINDRHENDPSCRLQDGDSIKIFSSISGG